MKFPAHHAIIAIASSLFCAPLTVSAATVVSSEFLGLGNSAIDVDLTGKSYGYITDKGIFDGPFGGIASQGSNYVHTNVLWGNLERINGDQSGVDSGVNVTAVGGAFQNVYFTEPGGANNLVDSRNGSSMYRFGGSAFTGGEIGQFQNGDDDIFTLEFRDMGIGTFDIVLYFDGKNDALDYYQMDHSLNGGSFSSTTMANTGIQSLTGNTAGDDLFSYNITVTTTAATDDLTLRFGSAGRAGNMFFAGYTVEAIPEPSVALLGGLGALLLLRRRRCD